MRIAVFTVALCLLAAAPFASAAPDGKTAPDEVFLCDGRVLAGTITGLDEDGTLTIAPQTGEPLHVNAIEIKALRFDKALVRDPDAARRDFVFLLADSTRITGRIIACDGTRFTLRNHYIGRIQIAVSAVTHIITNPFAQISDLQNSGPGCLFVLKDGSYVRGELLPPRPAEKDGRLAEFRCKADGKTRVLPVEQVCGLVMPAAIPVSRVQGWYARVYLANFDRFVGTLEIIGTNSVTLATPLLGEIEIGRAAVEDMVFGPNPRATLERALLCCAGQVVEVDELMRVTRTYTTPRPSREKFSSLSVVPSWSEDVSSSGKRRLTMTLKLSWAIPS